MLNGVLDSLNFIEQRDIVINKLSTGTKMKVSIACVLIGNFDLILLDEPFANLDQDTCKTLLSIITEIKRCRGTTFIVSSHADLLDDNYYDHKLFLRDKKIN